MKKPEEIKKGMQHCLYNDFANYGCKGCPYQLPGGFSRMHECQYDVVKDVFSLIQQLESTYSQVSKGLCGKENATLDEVLQAIAQVKAELEAVKRERDAAVDALGKSPPCENCTHFDCQWDKPPCLSCVHSDPVDNFTSNFEWRGVCPENTEVQDG